MVDGAGHRTRGRREDAGPSLPWSPARGPCPPARSPSPAGHGRPNWRRTLGVAHPGHPPQGTDRPSGPPGHRHPRLAHRPARARLLPGAVARRTGGLRRHHGGRGRIRPPADGGRGPPAPPGVPAHRSGPGPGHGGGDQGWARGRRHRTTAPSSARCRAGPTPSWPPATAPRASCSVPTARWPWPGTILGSRRREDPIERR